MHDLIVVVPSFSEKHLSLRSAIYMPMASHIPETAAKRMICSARARQLG